MWMQQKNKLILLTSKLFGISQLFCKVISKKRLGTLRSDGGGCLRRLSWPRGIGKRLPSQGAKIILTRPSRRRGQLCLHIFDFYRKILHSWLPLERFVAFFFKVLMMAIYQRTSSFFFMTLTHPKTQIFLMNVMENLTLMIWMTVSVYPSFVFIRVTFPSFLRPYIFLTTLYVNKEQYAMELKGCVSHFEGLRTHVDSVI